MVHLVTHGGYQRARVGRVTRGVWVGLRLGHQRARVGPVSWWCVGGAEARANPNQNNRVQLVDRVSVWLRGEDGSHPVYLPHNIVKYRELDITSLSYRLWLLFVLVVGGWVGLGLRLGLGLGSGEAVGLRLGPALGRVVCRCIGVLTSWGWWVNCNLAWV